MTGDESVGPFEGPPRTFEDRRGREIRITEYDGDFEALVEMYVAFPSEDRAQGIPPVREEAIRSWLEGILGDECLNVVAKHDSRAIGHATLVPDGEDAYELAIFVLDTHQSAGIGTHLIETLLGLGATRGVDEVWLTVERWNDPAIALYRKVGFEPTGTDSFELEMATRLH